MAFNIIESTSDPVVTDDSLNLSVRKGTKWHNTATDDLFECTDPAPGAAVWNKISEFSATTAQAVTPNTDSGTASKILAGNTNVAVGAVTNDANDWIVLPAVADVPEGHQIRICCNAGGNFEMRTPATSGEKINTVDSDGTQEYLCVDAEVVVVTKVSTTDGWAALDIPALGGAGAATVPD
jgi:hypothetical protein